MTYVNEYVHNLDARNRVTVPSNWRVEGDEGNYYLAWQHPNGFIAVYPPDIQEELREKMRSTQLTDVDKQKALIDARVDIEDFKDPEFVEKFVRRFLILKDSKDAEAGFGVSSNAPNGFAVGLLQNIAGPGVNFLV